jgi:hypothetical protein
MQISVVIMLSLFFGILALQMVEHTRFVQETVNSLCRHTSLSCLADGLMAYARALYDSNAQLQELIANNSTHTLHMPWPDQSAHGQHGTILFTQQSAHEITVDVLVRHRTGQQCALKGIIVVALEDQD